MADLTTHHLHTSPQTSAIPRVRSIDTERPWAWLAAGWRDMCASPTIIGP